MYFSTPFPPSSPNASTAKKNALNDDKEYYELEAELSKFQSLPTSTSLPANTTRDELKASLQRLALQVISLFDESDVLYYMLDRVHPSKSVKPNELDHRALLEVLVAMVQTARAKLRVLVVVNGWNWNGRNYEDELGITMKNRILIHERRQSGRLE